MTDREKLIKLIQTSPADIMGNHGIGNMADHLIANGVTIADKTAVVEKPQWIPVKERLPEEDGYYLALDGSGYIGKRYFYKDHPHLFINNLPPDTSVTHWMPLPEPPEEE